MSTLGDGLRRLWYVLNQRRFDRALAEEMEAHREMMHDPSRFGNTLRLRERSRDAWGWTWVDDIVRDVRLAARALRRTPSFTGITLASLVLGLTLAASTVAVANAYLLRSLPYPAAHRLYHVMYAPPGPYEPGGISALDWTAVSDVVEYPVTASGATFYLGDDAAEQPVRALRVNRGFVEALGVHAVLGRSFTPDDFTRASDLPAMIGDALWRNRFGGDSSVIGRVVRATVGERVESQRVRIVGVLPPGFWFGRESSAVMDVLLPLTSPARTYMVRLREGAPVALAERRITDAARAVATSLTPDWTGVHLESAHERYVGPLRPVLVGVTVAGAIVLVIACLNVAVLVLLRALHRQKEMAVRIALGAGRRHILQLLVAESGLLCAAAVVLVAALTTVTLRALAPLIETELGRPAPRGVSAIGVDATVLLAIAIAGMLVALMLCAVPLATPWRRRLSDTLSGAGRHGADRPAAQRFRIALIGFELASSLVLLVGCGMMIRSVVHMVSTDLGFRIDGVTRVRVLLPTRAYPNAATRAAFFHRFTDRMVATVHGKAALASWPPFAESLPQPVIGDGAAADAQAMAGVTAVGPGYFGVLDISVREGRAFTPRDDAGAEPVAMVSETLARRLWPTSSAVGHRVRAVDAVGTSTPAATWRTVVGVVRDVRQTYGDVDIADVYVPFFQVAPEQYAALYVKAAGDTRRVASLVTGVMEESDPFAVIRDVLDVEDENRQLAGARFLTAMLSVFAAFGTFLTAVGLYGVIAYAVGQRRREFAIRVALGATRQAVTTLSMRSAGIMLALGLGGGSLAAGATTRVLRSRLYGVPEFDVWSMLGAAALLAIVGLAAVWLPAHRAASVDPVNVLRDE
jgi:predicted permease